MTPEYVLFNLHSVLLVRFSLKITLSQSTATGKNANEDEGKKIYQEDWDSST